MKVSLRPRSPFRVSLPISRMFIAVYVVFTLGVADGGRDPVGSADGSWSMLLTALLIRMPK